MENLELIQFKNIFKNKKVLITGHTGFKGSWLAFWLKRLGSKVYGISHKKFDTKLFPEIEFKFNKKNELIVNLSQKKNYFMIKKFLKKNKPEIVFFLAAQPIVKKSFIDPIETWESNLLSVNYFINLIKELNFIKNILIITTDKVYDTSLKKNKSFVETDKLGGSDPYSLSKVAVEHFVKSIKENLKCKIITVRAGNVIGGGDWGENRLIPDIVRSSKDNTELVIRNKNSTRPWQHVLDCLSGYLFLGQLLIESKIKSGSSWNISNKIQRKINVLNLVNMFRKKIFLKNIKFKKDNSIIETANLKISSKKIYNLHGWHNTLTINDSINKTVEWYSNYLNPKINNLSAKQLDEYIKLAKKRKRKWIK
ncbi:MAG: CDP-glucose 4,6-dehydratase [Euryarchaeota archaeon]|nr:CDP-glucose 4,6-dehydratase [Euryarchaeota archaeon]